MNVKVIVGRFDNNTVIEVPQCTTIIKAMNDAAFVKAANDEIQDMTGNKYTGDEPVVEGKAYFLVERVKSGLSTR